MQLSIKHSLIWFWASGCRGTNVRFSHKKVNFEVWKWKFMEYCHSKQKTGCPTEICVDLSKWLLTALYRGLSTWLLIFFVAGDKHLSLKNFFPFDTRDLSPVHPVPLLMSVFPASRSHRRCLWKHESLDVSLKNPTNLFNQFLRVHYFAHRTLHLDVILYPSCSYQ